MEIGSGIFFYSSNGDIMKKNFIYILALFILFTFCTTTAQATEKEAVAAARSWLAIVDNGNHIKSWEEASTYFKKNVTVKQWSAAVENARSSLGKVLKREFASAQHHTSLPGAPDGKYVVIFFTTQFENKKQATETITPMLDKDGTWRVSGYYVK